MDNLKKPKSKEEKIFSNDVECLLIGVMIMLISIIGLLNKGPVGNFLTYIGVYLFGAFYFLLFLILIFFSIYLMIKKKVYHLHINMHFFGVLLIFLSCIIASSTSTTEINFGNLLNTFQEHMAVVSSSPLVIDSISNLAVVGGGFIGFLLKAILNTCITEVGTTIVYITFMALGIALLLKDCVMYLIKFFMNIHYERKKKSEEVKEALLAMNNSNTNNNQVAHEKKFYDEPLKEPITRDNINQIPQNNQIENKIDSSFFDNLKTEEEIVNEEPKFDIPSEIEELDIPRKETLIKDYFSDEIDDENNDLANFDNKQESETNISSYFSEEINNEEIKKENVNNYYQESLNIEENKNIGPEPKVEINENNNVYKQLEVETKVNSQPIIQPKPQEQIKPVNKKKYILPSGDLLQYHAHEDTKLLNENEAQIKLEKINKTFSQYKIGAQVISYTIGPSVTRFNVRMNEGVRVNTLASITNEISIALNGDKSVRLELIVEGRDTSSIEVGNKKATPVSFKECFDAVKDKISEKDKLLIPLGKDIENQVVTTYMNDLPHVLVAGTTGSGKSVFVNTIIATFIMRNTPEELKLILVDPKKVEFTPYNNIAHLLCPIITEANEASAMLKKLCEEMDDRYAQLSLRGVAKIQDYNELAEKKGYPKMPSIVLVIDEFADLISKNAKEIEGCVQRICQKARAAGIYLILCTQRPSVNVVTGDIKAVIPSRIGLLVPQAVDSKVILDQTGAESLLGYGDMLCQIPKRSGLVRVQGAYISGVEIAEICDCIRSQREVEYDPKFCNLAKKAQPSAQFGERSLELDELHEEAKEHVLKTRIASTSNLQSYLSIGFARADHILNCLEQEGIVKRVSGNRRIVVAPTEEENEE